MKLAIDERQSGKTTLCVKYAELTGAYIITSSKSMAECVKMTAEYLNKKVEVLDLKTYLFKVRNGMLTPNKPIIIDELQIVLREIFNNEICLATMDNKYLSLCTVKDAFETSDELKKYSLKSIDNQQKVKSLTVNISCSFETDENSDIVTVSIGDEIITCYARDLCNILNNKIKNENILTKDEIKALLKPNKSYINDKDVIKWKINYLSALKKLEKQLSDY